MPTIKEICDEIYRGDTEASGRRGPKSRPIPITRGLQIRNAPGKQGLVQLTPEQALGVIVERLTVNGQIDGYQRVQNITHARKIAAAIRRGEDVGEVSLALDSGRHYCDDGAHRLIACVIARKPIWAVVRHRDLSGRAARFANQQLARRVNADVLALANDGPVHRYIQAAVVARKNGLEHPWAALVGAKNSSLVMGPNVAVMNLTAYSLGLRPHGAFPAGGAERVAAEFEDAHGAELARLLLTFGTKSTNPLAFRPAAIRAIADLAVLAIARTGRKQRDIERWEKHMASFDWPGYAYLRSSRDLSLQLVRKWNLRLGHDKKIAEW